MTNHISGIRSCEIFCLRCQRQDVKCCSRRGDSGLGAGCRGTELFFTHPMPSGSAGGRFHRHASRLWPWSLLGADGLEDIIDHFYYGNLPATQQSYDSFLQFVESTKECCRQRPLELPPLHLDGIVLWCARGQKPPNHVTLRTLNVCLHGHAGVGSGIVHDCVDFAVPPSKVF